MNGEDLTLMVEIEGKLELLRSRHEDNLELSVAIDMSLVILKEVSAIIYKKEVDLSV